MLVHCSITVALVHFLGIMLISSSFENTAVAELIFSKSFLSKSPYFGILHTLQNYAEWAAKEEEIAKTLTSRLEFINIQQKLIQRYLKEHSKAIGNARKYLIKLNPTPESNRNSSISRHGITWRYATFINKLFDLQTCSDYLNSKSSLKRTLKSKNEKLVRRWRDGRKATFETQSWVGWEDLYMSMNTFFHNQEVYGFDPSVMTKGIGVHTFFGGTLLGLHSAELGIFALNKRKHSIAIQWLEMAKSLLDSENSENRKLGSSGVVPAMLSLAIQQHNRQFAFQSDANKTGREYSHNFNFYMNPVTERNSPEERVYYRQILYWWHKGLGNETYPEFQFMDLCMGKVAQTAEMQINLKCHYENRRHPYLYINPVKVEQLSESPPIFQFYEMIGNATIEKIKRENRPHVQLSRIVGGDDVDATTLKRTSAGVFMFPFTTPKIVYNLAEYVSGLNIRGNSEFPQFAEYTYGRFYTFHSDAIENAKKSAEKFVENPEDDRLATILYYLELPEIGGYTPFCEAGIYSRPVRGSAVFWYNLYRNGSTRPDVKHGSCPVIFGHKIIINHWIDYNGNWNKFKCSKNRLE